MAYFSQNDDSSYKAYYKPKAPPGGASSIMFGGDEKPSAKPEAKSQAKPFVLPEATQQPKPEVQKDASSGDAQKENSRPGTGESKASDKSEDKNVTVSTKLDPIKPKTNDIFAKSEYPGQDQSAPAQSKKNNGYRVMHPPGGKSSGPLW